MARKNLYAIDEADIARAAYQPPTEPTVSEAKPRQTYRNGKRAIMFFVTEEEFSQMHVILARNGRKRVQTLMQELLDDWFRRQAAPRLRE
jgi:hypothetical protein